MKTNKFPGRPGLVLDEPLIFSRSVKGRCGYSLPALDESPEEILKGIPPELIRDEIKGFVEVSEVDVVRHWTRLSKWNYGVDDGLYPLGSCTMKYNPKMNEKIAMNPRFTDLHPYLPDEMSQGCLKIMYELERYLEEISGMKAVTLQPAAGAHGELTGLLIARAFFKDRGDGAKRRKVLIPDTAHGTNPASATLAGMEVVEFRCGEEGVIPLHEIERLMTDEVAVLMTTNPNTLGIFEENILAIEKIVHERGGLIYCDGANLNAIMGYCRPGDLGYDIIQFNLHKTFSTPHGGGGPGSGPVGVSEPLSKYLPIPRISFKEGRYILDYSSEKSIGRVKAFFGNFLVLLKAYLYIREMGADGLKKVSELAVLNANYLKEKLRKIYNLPITRPTLHEFVLSEKGLSEKGVKTMDIAKRLIDFGFHPPTIYFPLVVRGALMIEPTETESLESIEEFALAMERILEEVKQDPVTLRSAPHLTHIKRLDDVLAARRPDLRFKPSGDEDGEIGN